MRTRTLEGASMETMQGGNQGLSGRGDR